MHRKLIVLVFFVLWMSIVKSVDAQTINWLTFENAVEQSSKKPRKIMVDVYTDWCHWCKVMDKETFSSPNISKIVSENFYAVKFNGESKDTVLFKNQQFVSTGQGARPPHQLAVALLQGKLSYPSIVFLDENFDLITVLPGFHKPDEMEPILMYIHQAMYAKNVSFPDFLKTYKPQ